MDLSNTDVERFQAALKDHSNYDFDGYSLNSLKRRLAKVLEDYTDDLDRLIRIISKDPLALEEIVKKITVNTTEMFRDPPVWRSIILKLLPRFQDNSHLHIWHPGCSTGQEVFTMMIILDQLGLLDRSKIYASDINEDVLKVAEKGAYRLRFNRDYLSNYDEVFSSVKKEQPGYDFHPFTHYLKVEETRDRILMKDHLRKKPVYEKIDLVTDENKFMINFDIILCRNVIIYFDQHLQNRVLQLFHRNMRPNGCLVLGHHESIIGTGTNLFLKEDQFYVKK